MEACVTLLQVSLATIEGSEAAATPDVLLFPCPAVCDSLLQTSLAKTEGSEAAAIIHTFGLLPISRGLRQSAAGISCIGKDCVQQGGNQYSYIWCSAHVVSANVTAQFIGKN